MTVQKAGEMLSESMRTIYLWSLSKLSDPYQAEELSSEIMLATLQSVHRLQNDDAFFGFLWQVAANSYKAYLRRRKRHTTAVLDDGEGEEAPEFGDLSDILSLREQQRALRRELAMLSADYRHCTVAYYFDRLSYREIGEKYGLSTDMVKYYLLRSKQILKEGIAMERQFGEKSYNPAPFRFSCLYSGRNDWYYNALMNRTLPGQILLSAYYTPMSVEQLSVELGVACVYLEEELKLLMECGFVKKEGKNRYRSTLLVLPKEYIETVYDKLDLRCAHKVADIIRALREKLPEIRRIGFGGSDLADTNLLWDLLAFVVVSGNSHYAATTASLKYEKDKNGVDRICWAENYRKEDNKYAAFSYAAQSFPYEDRHDSYTFIDFWLPEGRGHFEGLCSLTLEEAKKRCPVFSKKELAELCEIIKEEFDKAAVLVRDAVTESTALLVQHTPEDLQERAEKINPQIAPSSLVGWYGGAALHTGALDLPGEGTWAWIIGYTNEE